MNKATINIPDSEPIEVNLDAISLPEGLSISDGSQIPDGYVKQEVMDASIEKRLARHKRSLLNDAEYVREVIELNVPGIQFGEDGKPVLPKPAKEVDIDALREQVVREIASPLKTEIESLQGLNGKLLESKKRSDIMRAALKHGIHEDYLLPASDMPNAPTLWENMISGMYEYSGEYNVHAVKDGENFALNPNGTRENPILDIDSHTALLKKNPAYQRFFKVEGQKGSGFSQNGGSTVGGKVTREAFSTGQISADQLEQIASGKLKVA